MSAILIVFLNKTSQRSRSVKYLFGSYPFITIVKDHEGSLRHESYSTLCQDRVKKPYMSLSGAQGWDSQKVLSLRQFFLLRPVLKL